MANCRFWMLDESAASTRGGWKLFSRGSGTKAPHFAESYRCRDEASRSLWYTSPRRGLQGPTRRGEITQQALFSSKCRHPSVYASRSEPREREREDRAHWTRTPGIKKMDPLVRDTICVRSQVSLSPISLCCPILSLRSFGCALPLSSYDRGKGRQMVFLSSTNAERIGSQSEDHDMHVRLAQAECTRPFVSLALPSSSLPLPHVFAENAEFAITAPERAAMRPWEEDGVPHTGAAVVVG